MTSVEQRAQWRQRAEWLAELGLAAGEPAPVEVIEEVANAALTLLDEVDRLEAQLTEARAYARGFEHGRFSGLDTGHPPEWLTAPLELDEDG